MKKLLFAFLLAAIPIAQAGTYQWSFCSTGAFCAIPFIAVKDSDPAAGYEAIASTTGLTCNYVRHGTTSDYSCDAGLAWEELSSYTGSESAITVVRVDGTALPGHYILLIPATNGTNELSTATAGVYQVYLKNPNTKQIHIEVEVGGSTTVANIADGVWDEVASGHTTSGTFGEQSNTFAGKTYTVTSATNATVFTSTDLTVDSIMGRAIAFPTNQENSAQSTACNVEGEYAGTVTAYSAGQLTVSPGLTATPNTNCEFIFF